MTIKDQVHVMHDKGQHKKLAHLFYALSTLKSIDKPERFKNAVKGFFLSNFSLALSEVMLEKVIDSITRISAKLRG